MIFSGENRRQTIISLTEYARSLQEKYELVSEQMNTLFYRGFSENEQKQFEQYLARILDTLTEIEHANKAKPHENKFYREDLQ